MPVNAVMPGRNSPAPMSGQPDPLGFAGLNFALETRHNPRARRMTLRVNQARRTVTLTLPRGCDPAQARTFVERNLPWIEARIAELPEVVPFDDGALVPFEGELHEIVFRGPKRRAAVVWRQPRSGSASKKGPDHPQLCVAGQTSHAPRRLRDWLVRRCGEKLRDRVRLHAQNLGFQPRRIAIRDQTTRWGSCSSSGTLSFSWRLILAPPPVLDYVAAHEVAHLGEMNHGPAFWRLVGETMPDMTDARAWLAQHGRDLHRYGARRSKRLAR